MKPSERVKELLPQCFDLWTEKAREKITTNSFAPTRDEFNELLKGPAADLMHGIITETYASAILQAVDEAHESQQKQIEALWSKIRDMNGGPFPGDP